MIKGHLSTRHDDIFPWSKKQSQKAIMSIIRLELLFLGLFIHLDKPIHVESVFDNKCKIGV